jgi:hypothetical protein
MIKLKHLLNEVSYDKSGLKNPKLADRDKDNKISSWEKKVGQNIEKNIDESIPEDQYNIGMKKYSVTKPKLSQNETEKIKGGDGKGCWKGYRYAGTENGKDKCIRIKEAEETCQCGAKMENKLCTECGYMQEGIDVLGKPSSDHEASMAKAELRDMIENSQDIYEMIEVGTELPAWISSYITLASDYMHSVKEYMAEKTAEMDLEAPDDEDSYDYDQEDYDDYSDSEEDFDR